MKSTCVLCLSLLAGSAAFAADSLQLRTEVFREVEAADAAGRKVRKLEPAQSLAPGSDVTYVVTYRNTGAQPAEHVVVSNPLPKELQFVADASGGAEVSADGGKTWGRLGSLPVTAADGKSRLAVPADVTDIRWTVPGAVAPGGEGRVSYRAHLK